MISGTHWPEIKATCIWKNLVHLFPRLGWRCASLLQAQSQAHHKPCLNGHCLYLEELGGPIVTVASRGGNSSGLCFSNSGNKDNVLALYISGVEREVHEHVPDYVPGMREEDANF